MFVKSKLQVPSINVISTIIKYNVPVTDAFKIGRLLRMEG